MSSYYYSDTGSALIKEIDAEEPRQLRYFSFFSALSQIFGILMLFFTGYWHSQYNGGYVWGKNYMVTNSSGTYPFVVRGNRQYHETFMTFGLVFLQGEAILMYRLFRHERKIFSKFLHGLFHLFAVIFFVFGLIAIATDKNNLGNTHMFSAHSWVGVSVMVSFILQYIAGFISFGFPKTSPAVRAWYLPIHRAVGLIIFVVSCVQVLLGIMQETWILFIGSNYFGGCYSVLDCHGQGLVVNFNVIFLLLYGITVVYLASSKKFARQRTPDEAEHI